MDTPQPGARWRRFATIVLLGYAALAAVVIFGAFVDIPHRDEWLWVSPAFLGGGWSTRWFWHFHDVHRELPTWLLTMANMRCFGLDFKLQLAFNLAIYYAMVWSVWKLIAAPTRSLVALALIAPFLSSLNVENHTMSEQGAIHICMWTFLCGTYLLYHHAARTGFAAGLVLLVTSMYSGAAGLPAVTVSYPVFVAYALASGAPGLRARAAVGGLVVAAFALLWFNHFEYAGKLPTLTYPWAPGFFAGLGGLMAFGFGYQGFSQVVGWLALTAVVGASALGVRQVIRARSAVNARQPAFLLALLVGVCAILGSVVLGRAGHGPFALRWSRYFEYAVFLPLLCFAIVPRDSSRLHWLSLALFAFTLIGSWDDFGFGRYVEDRAARVVAKSCVLGLIHAPERNPRGVCETTFPGRLTERVRYAALLGMKFTRAPF
jgi:hypothetical protein